MRTLDLAEAMPLVGPFRCEACPSYMEFEERRACYVAMTRARSEVDVEESDPSAPDVG